MTEDSKRQHPDSVVTSSRPKHHHRRILLLIGVLVLCLAGAGALSARHFRDSKSPVPHAITRSVSFPVYYPDPKKLPNGYSLDTTSFNMPEKDVVLYAVRYGQNRLVFSVQPKPSPKDLNSFASDRIPLHTTISTPVGKAIIGAIGNQTVVSLPTTTNAWIIVTGPYDTNQNALDQVLTALEP